MSIFNVELKKVVDDTYDIEIGSSQTPLYLTWKMVLWAR